MFLECDSCGQLLWMSERSGLPLGGTQHPLDAARAGTRSRADARMPAAFSAGREQTAALLGLETSLLQHCLRLQSAERDLSTFARQRRSGSGRGAVRQIELERQRLGRELHTGLGQMLAAIRLQLEIVAALLPGPPALVQQALSRISTLANDALEQVRSVSARLHPPEWQRLTLEAALQQLWDMSGIPQRFQSSFRIQPLPHEPDLEVKVLIYRAAQEALSNIARHARATASMRSSRRAAIVSSLPYRMMAWGLTSPDCSGAPPAWYPALACAPSANKPPPSAENSTSKAARLALH